MSLFGWFFDFLAPIGIGKIVLETISDFLSVVGTIAGFSSEPKMPEKYTFVLPLDPGSPDKNNPVILSGQPPIDQPVLPGRSPAKRKPQSQLWTPKTVATLLGNNGIEIKNERIENDEYSFDVGRHQSEWTKYLLNRERVIAPIPQDGGWPTHTAGEAG